MATTTVEQQPNYESWFKIHGALDGKEQSYYFVGLRERFHIDSLKSPAPKDQPVKYADIGYDVDKERYKARGKARVAAGGLETDVPAFWPKQV
jgi:hypothetical protein